MIVGAGGFGRETASAVRACNERNEEWNLLGFVDDDPSKRGLSFDGVPVIGGLDAVGHLDGAALVLCVGGPRRWWTRAVVADRLALPPDRYASIVHPAASLAPGTAVGPGSVVLAGCVTTTALEIGAHVHLMPAVVLTHDDIVGDHTTFASGVRVSGGCTIERGAYLGAGALIGEQVTIGEFALVGMGSVVRHDVPAREVWAGVPARRLRTAAAP